MNGELLEVTNLLDLFPSSYLLKILTEIEEKTYFFSFIRENYQQTKKIKEINRKKLKELKNLDFSGD